MGAIKIIIVLCFMREKNVFKSGPNYLKLAVTKSFVEFFMSE